MDGGIEQGMRKIVDMGRKREREPKQSEEAAAKIASKSLTQTVQGNTWWGAKGFVGL